MDKNITLTIQEEKIDTQAIKFCDEFVNSDKKKYIFGRNDFAASIANSVDIDGFIDEFTTEKSYLNKSIVKTDDIPSDALIVGSIIGKPLLAEKRMEQLGLNYLDYFTFHKYSGLLLKQVMFWEGFSNDFKVNRNRYEEIYNLLVDDTSKTQFEKIINFRLSYNLDFMRSFKAIEELQYFEDFLPLNINGESFVDIGGFDGYTSEEFIRKYPGYKAVYFFEPEEKNMHISKQRLGNQKNIHLFQKGVSDKKETLRFDTGGSCSKISKHGNIKIDVDKLDDMISEPVTFIKMDIEGAERKAIEGAKDTIKKYHPILAICVYHQFDDFWQIPQQIFSIRDDYQIYLRHYTEGIAETVMFFIPKSRQGLQ
ncbi:MAG: FkbM family methyltransferase [Methyloprofundus sp.]|nr:FkbM family methyltransferase [Methyloprofundus sp.]